MATKVTLVYGMAPGDTEPSCLKLMTEPRAQIGVWALLSVFIVVNPNLQGPKWRLLRTASFVATGFSAFVPIIHAATIFPYAQLDKQAGLRYYYLEGFLLLIGVYHFTVPRFSVSDH
jgi:predicted membrane channel-forming protein YqfA (hemolysin III family)